MTRLVIEGGTLIDATGSEPKKDVVIVIEDQRIKSVGKKGEIPIPKGNATVNAKGKTILPGLIDGHCHLYDFMGELCLNLGVTTCPDILENSDAWVLAQREGTRTGKIRGPRIWAAGTRLIAPPPAWAPRGLIGHELTTPEQARTVVKRKKELGLDIIKIQEYLAPDVFRAAVEEANRQGIPVTCHTLDVFFAAECGVAGVEHHWAPGMTSIADPEKRWQTHQERMSGKFDTAELPFYYQTENFDRIIETMVEKQIAWSPTIATWFRPLSPNVSRFKARELSILDNPKAKYLPPSVRDLTMWLHERYEKYSPERLKRIKEGYGKIEEFIRRFVKAGGILKAGSDPNHGMPALDVHEELTMFVEAGLSPIQAIQAGTINVAKAYRKDKDFGTIEPGKIADIVVVDGDPLKDMWVTQNVKTVVLNGKLVDTNFHSDHKNPIPGSEPFKPTPRAIEIFPGAIPQGSEPTKLKVTTRRGFQTWHTVTLDGKEIKTRFVGRGELEATVPAQVLKRAGTYTVNVVSPNEFNSKSAPAYLIVPFRN